MSAESCPWTQYYSELCLNDIQTFEVSFWCKTQLKYELWQLTLMKHLQIISITSAKDLKPSAKIAAALLLLRTQLYLWGSIKGKKFGAGDRFLVEPLR